MSVYQLAQFNIARMLAPADSPELADFMANIDRINALADESSGFVWRLQDDTGSATSFRPLSDDMLVNMSVWEDSESLHNYVYSSAHIELMRRRKEWFKHMADAYMVLWWIPAGSLPNIEQAMERLQRLRRLGPSATAFTFKRSFGPAIQSPGTETDAQE
jgi:hypothetical protein